jgi:hypothetical protein
VWQWAALLRALTSSKIIIAVQKILHIVKEYELRLQGMPFACVRLSVLIIFRSGFGAIFFLLPYTIDQPFFCDLL